MTDNEIIKAFECCVINKNCGGCPLQSTNTYGCVKMTGANALALINRQKAEIESLTIDMNAARLGMIAEHERLQTARSEAIKEFAERLKVKALTTIRGGQLGVIDCYEIDNLVKEMTEKKDDGKL